MYCHLGETTKKKQTKDKHSGLYVFFPVITKSKAWREIHKRPNAYSSSINLTDEWTMLQSIYSHAGCDHLRYCRILGHWCFNPHTHVGCDILYLRYITWYWRFQSTHPRRVWLDYGFENNHMWVFQSTHPRRVWLPGRNKYSKYHGVSIHTPT